MCIPKSNHKVLIDSCYPIPKNLPSAGPEYKPNGNELSRLAFYCSSKPAKLAKVGSVLEAKAAADAKAVTGSGVASEKAKASLMITLGIVKELINECRRDLNYFSRSTQAVIASALQAAAKGAPGGKRDLELTSRAGSTFYALANFMDLSSASIDASIGTSYQALLRQFAAVAVENAADGDDQNRARLIGLGAIAGAVGSDALYSYSFAQQAGVVVPALLTNIAPGAVSLNFLKSESAKASKSGASFGDFAAQRRPIANRRAPSLKGGLPEGEKAPGSEQVASASLGTLHALLAHADAGHVATVMTHVLAFLDGKVGAGKAAWGDSAWVSWLSETLASWPALQYRFVVLTALVEYLVEECEGASNAKYQTLIEAITTILRSKLSLIGLSTSETVSNLLGLTVRRVHQDTRDRLLPPLVESVAALGTHSYYADQLNDMAEEIAARIVTLQLPEDDMGGAGKVSSGPAVRKSLKSSAAAKIESIRTLLFCLIRLIDVANEQSAPQPPAKGGDAAAQTNGGLNLGASGSRARISADVFTQITSLLVHPSAAVRTTYAQALVRFLEVEAKSSSALAGPAAGDLSQVLPGAKLDLDAGPFAHVLGAASNVLAVANVLYEPTTIRESPLETLALIDRASTDDVRKGQSESSSALPLDYSAIEAIFLAALKSLPIPTTLHALTGLVAAGEVAPKRLSATPHRIAAINAVIASVLNKAGQVWDVSGLQSGSGARGSGLPALPAAPKGLVAPSEPVPWSLKISPNSASAPSRSGTANALSSSKSLQSATGLSASELSDWLNRDWSVSVAVDDAANSASPLDGAGVDSVPQAHRALEGVAAAARAAKASEGGKASSIAGRSVTTAGGSSTIRQGTGVEDLREALGNRAYGSAAAKKRPTSPGTASNGGSVNGTAGSGLAATLGFNGGASADRRASRRVSRRESSQQKPNGNGAAAAVSGAIGAVGGLLGAGGKDDGKGEIGGILDEMNVPGSVAEDEATGAKIVPPYAA